MSKVKLFDLSRFVNLSTHGGAPTYLNPSDIYCVESLDVEGVLIYAGDRTFRSPMGMGEFESEVNRALEATHKAHMDVAEEAKEKVQELMKELNKPTKVDPFKMNDFYPEQEN